MAADGVLILSHCGFSFVEDLVAAIGERNLQAWILSSKPLPEHGEQRLQVLREKASVVISTDSHELNREDVENAIAALQRQGHAIKGCITVWEGYRALMAHANALLGVADLSPQCIDALRNKLGVRNALHAAGLSQVAARALTPTVLDQLKADGGAYFIKPGHGIASYGTFRLNQSTTWATLEEISARVREDTVYKSALGDGVSFIAEDYLKGTEFSFEVLVAAGQAYVVGIHEKCQITEAEGMVLEDSCTSPPSSITDADSAAGIAWIRAVLAHLSLDWGCFHIEARFDGRRWDLIEINPRVGGSLISHSVKALNDAAGVLELWLDLLIFQANGQAHAAFLETLERLSYCPQGIAPTENATFFRVYFASPGRIESIDIAPSKRAPVISSILLKSGDEIEPASREVFLGQLLWRMSREESDAELPALLQNSASAINVQYQRSETASGARL